MSEQRLACWSVNRGEPNFMSMKYKPLVKSLIAYGVVVAVAALLLVYHLGGILPVLMMMGVVMGAAHLAGVFVYLNDGEEPPADFRD